MTTPEGHPPAVFRSIGSSTGGTQEGIVPELLVHAKEFAIGCVCGGVGFWAFRGGRPLAAGAGAPGRRRFLPAAAPGPPRPAPAPPPAGPPGRTFRPGGGAA